MTETPEENKTERKKDSKKIINDVINGAGSILGGTLLGGLITMFGARTLEMAVDNYQHADTILGKIGDYAAMVATGDMTVVGIATTIGGLVYGGSKLYNAAKTAMKKN